VDSGEGVWPGSAYATTRRGSGLWEGGGGGFRRRGGAAKGPAGSMAMD
jgi:hypothetical protein